MNLRELPKVSDSVSFLYIEFARIEQDNFSIKVVRETEEIPIPITAFTVLCLGPGTSITHQAIKICAEVGCLISWIGRNLSPYYAVGFGKTRSSKNLLKQVNSFSNDAEKLQVIRKMYRLRFPNIDMTNKTIEQMRGMEGVRVKTVYSTLSKSYGVKWYGRDYKVGKYTETDNINQAITYANQILYGVCKSVIVSLGYNVSLGFIHTGNIFSFVYDIADLYKMKTSVPASFKTISQLNNKDFNEGLLRRNLYEFFNNVELLKTMIKDLEFLFDGIDLDSYEDEGALFDGENKVDFGRNYGDLE